MKKLYALLTLVAACLTSCNENEVPFYAADSDGIYFNYTEENEFTASVNFANYMVGDSTFLSVPIKLKTLGYLSEQDRRVVLKEEAVDSYEKPRWKYPTSSCLQEKQKSTSSSKCCDRQKTTNNML